MKIRSRIENSWGSWVRYTFDTGS